MNLIESIKKISIIHAPIHLLHQKYIDYKSFIAYKKADEVIFKTNNPDSEKKYIIFKYSGIQGLMAQMEGVLAWVKYAVDHGYILVVDMNDEQNLYKIGDENAWENYYLQPMLSHSADKEYVDQIMAKENYAICPKLDRAAYLWIGDFKKYFEKFPPTIIHPSTRDYKNNPTLQKEFEALYQKYIRYTDDVKNYLKNEYDTILSGKDNVIGVIIRGTDYTAQRPYMHPVQPPVEYVIDKVKHLISEGKCKHIYLATDEKSVQEMFENTFPGMVITNNRRYYESDDYEKTPVRDIHLDRKNDTYLRGLEYLSSMNLLSNCDIIVGGLCGGSQAAILMNGGKYKEIHLFDFGDYGVNEKLS